MPYYSYLAVDDGGNMKDGLIQAADEFEALSSLKSKGFEPVNIRRKSFFFFQKPSDLGEVMLGKTGTKKERFEKAVRAAGSRRLRLTESINYDEFVIFLRELSVLINSGINIITALELLAGHSADAVLRRALVKVVENLSNGAPLHVAFSKDIKIFPNVFISMMQAGVISGNLPKILADLADYYEKEMGIRKRFIAALIYPTAVFTAALLGMFFLTQYIFPTFMEVFVKYNMKLPWPTKMLMFSVSFFKNPVALVIGFAVICVLGMALFNYLKTPIGKYQFDWAVINFPVIGNIIKKIMLCRFARTLGTLYESGINLSYALDITCEVIDNSYYQDEVKKLRDEILQTGAHMYKVIEKQGKKFPSIFSHFVSVGEETGNLGAMMKKIAHYFEEEIFYLFDNFVNMIEPIIISVLGVIVMFIMLSLFLPIYSIISQFSG